MPELRTHRVAKAAYERVNARQQAEFKKEYGALAHKLPGMVLQNGLAQATGFFLAKGTAAHLAIAHLAIAHLAILDDLLQVLRVSQASAANDRQAFHQSILDADLAQTLLLTRQALQAASWLKRYAQGVLRVDATGTVQGTSS